MRIFDALRFAAERHGILDQRYGGVDGLTSYPYIHHCASVVIILQQFGVDDEDVLVAGALHDVLEDTDTTSWEIEKLFGARVTKMVELVSNPDTDPTEYSDEGLFVPARKLSRKEKHNIQYPKIATDEGAILVKLGDRIANVETGGKIEMYRKEHEYFRSTLTDENLRTVFVAGMQRQDAHEYRVAQNTQPCPAERKMWEWLDEKMQKPLDK